MIEKPLAKKIMRAATKCSGELVEVVRDAQSCLEGAAFIKVRGRVASIMGCILSEIMSPIGEQHPDLYPKALRPVPKTIKEPPRRRKKPAQLGIGKAKKRRLG